VKVLGSPVSRPWIEVGERSAICTSALIPHAHGDESRHLY